MKPSKWYVILFLFLLIYSLAPARVSAQRLRVTTPDLDAVDRFVQAVGIPGLALAIVHGDEIVYQKGFGVADPTGRPVTPQTPFNIGSVSKAFTALTVMQLAEAGKLELDAPVQRYLPWFRVADAEASTRITILDLLNHTSGILPRINRPETNTPIRRGVFVEHQSISASRCSNVLKFRKVSVSNHAISSG